MDLFTFGIFLGLGAAIPIGPVNLEIIRRNLHYGTSYGTALGLGACTADLTYLILLCVGALSLLEYPVVLRLIGFLGSLILGWFAILAFRSTTTQAKEHKVPRAVWKHFIEGYGITLVNPYTILFWASVTSQISLAASTHENILILAGLGVIIGTVSWVFFLNIITHVTRHRLNATAIKWLNYLGGFILLGFAITGLIRVIIK